MKFFVVLLVTSALVATWSVTSQDEIKIALQIQPQSIKAGESAVLSWKVENANSLLISGIGRVDAEGNRRVNPLSTTRYTLVAENPARVLSETVELVVSGGRGGDEFPQDYSLYRYPVTYRRSTVSLVTFLEQVRVVLQDDMTFSVRGPQSEGTRYHFITNRSERDYLMQPDDSPNRIGRRRISYLVEVEPIKSNAKEFTYTIKELIEYKRRIEATWRIESNESVYRVEAERLHNRLSRLP